MSKNPLINALAATAYIAAVACLMFYGMEHVKANSVIIPIAVLSLFTLSAAIMGYIFCYQPLQLYFEDKKKEAVDLFLKTVGIFGVITFVIFLLMFLGYSKK